MIEDHIDGPRQPNRHSSADDAQPGRPDSTHRTGDDSDGSRPQPNPAADPAGEPDEFTDTLGEK